MTEILFATDAELDKARELYETDEVNIDGNAEVSPGSDGTWVQAWVLIPADTDFRCKGCGRPEGECSPNPCPAVLADRAS
jgi:hypothetical protein